MNARHALVVLFLSGALGIPTTSPAGVRDEKPNLIGGEVLGRGVVTLNYERFFTNHLGLGGGVMVLGASDGNLVAIVPLYASYVPGDVHSLYLSAGATLGVDSNANVTSNVEGQWAYTAALGYQFHSRGGFFVRPMFAYLADKNDPGSFIIWPGLTIGGSF